ncbi:MAG: ribosome biogenesis GTPase Der [Deltaproteobacteria bacterium]|nr:ribosome biogenesis GTPase Der [Deltaproteobacteria bacterium]
MSRLPVVAIVGRPNVGKSTLFNRLARRRIAIVDDEPGVTRDRLYAMARPPGYRFHLIDTGGLDPDNAHEFFVGIREQATVAIEEADVVIHVVDSRAGLHPDDRFVAELLRKHGKPAVTAANKSDAKDHVDLLPEFYELGVADVMPVSAAHGLGVSDLVDKVLSLLPTELRAEAEQRAADEDAQPRGRAARRAAAEAAEAEAPPPEEGEGRGDEVHAPPELRVAIVGRPNAGKSSLVNAILGEPRLMVSEIAGTTRDAVDTLVERDGKRYVLIDTAGLRRKRSVARKVEKFSVVAALHALEDAHVVCLVLDGYEGVTEQDEKIAEMAFNAGKALVIVVNKWDLVEDAVRRREEYAKRVLDEMGFVAYAPVVFASALHKQGTQKVLSTVDTVAQHHFRRVGTARINKAFERAEEGHHLPSFKGRRVSLYYATQVAIAPPTIVVACNMPEGIHPSYRRYLQNAMREQFGFVGTPLKIIFRRRGKDIGRSGHTHRKRRDPTQHG